MAKSREWSTKLREEIIAFHKKGNGYKKISRSRNISRDTVGSIIRKYKATGTVKTQPGRGRKKVLSRTAVRYLRRKVDQNPRLTAKSLQQDLTDVGIQVSAQTVRRTMRSEELCPSAKTHTSPEQEAQAKSPSICSELYKKATDILEDSTLDR